MNAITQAALDAAIAVLVPERSAPVPPFGYGSDLDCADDLTPGIGELQSSTLLLGQGLYHRITTQRGTLIDDPDYGIDVRHFLSLGMTQDQIESARGQISAELLKDERVDTVDVTLTFDGATISAAIAVTPLDSTTPFHLVVALTNGAAHLALLEAA